MRKFIPLVFVAVLAFGCKGGDGSTAVQSTGGTTTGGSTAAPSADGTYTLKLSPKEGDKTSYDFTMDAGPVKMAMGMNMTCTKAETNKYTMVSTFDNIKMSMNGKDAPAAATDQMKNMKVTAVMDSTGKTLSSSIEGAPAGSQAPEMSGTAFPDHPVKVGDTWDGTTKMSGTEVKAHYKLAKVEGNTATLEITMEGLPGGMTSDGMTTEIDLTTGMAISMHSKMSMKGPDGKDMGMTMEMKRK